MKISQLVIIIALYLLLLTVNRNFTEASSLRGYLGGLPWYGWAGIGVFIVCACVLFAFRDSIRARRLLEEEVDRHLAEEQRSLRMDPKLYEQLEPVKADYPHPVVIPNYCIGCRQCVEACPHDVLEMINDVAKPTAIDQCMENTRCEIVCPVSPKACVVVYATKEIKPLPVPPRTSLMSDDVPGCYIIGDVSGTPLIKNAANEGAAAIDFIKAELDNLPPEPNAEFDVAIIGIGPAGLSAAVRAKQCGLKYIGIERNEVLSTINTYPMDKPLFFKPETMAAKGAILTEGPGDVCQKVLDSWICTMNDHQVEIHVQEECETVTPEGARYFTIKTKKGEKGTERESRTYHARRVVIAVGNRGEPRKLDAPGAIEPRVRYALSKPGDFKGKKILVVGGGNASVEAAVALVTNRKGNEIKFRPPNEMNDVTFILKTNFTPDVKFLNKQQIYECIDKEKIRVCFHTTVKEICDRDVVVTHALTGEDKVIPNDYVFAMIGGVPPWPFLESIGIKIPKPEDAAVKKKRSTQPAFTSACPSSPAPDRELRG